MKKFFCIKNTGSLLIVFILITLLTVIRIGWINLFYAHDSVTGEQGVIDLTDIDDRENFRVHLKGKWSLYPNMLIHPDRMKTEETPNKVYIDFLESWNKYFEDSSAIRYGTYHLRIVKGNDELAHYGIKIPEGLSSYEVFVNGRLIGGLGNVENDLDGTGSISRPMTHYFILDQNENDIVIQGVQNNAFIDGGFSKSIILGDLVSMEKAKLFSIITQVGFTIVLILYFFFTILLSLIGIRDKSLIYFSLLSITTAVSVIVSHSRLLYIWVPIDWVWANKLFFFSYALAILLFILYLQTLIKEHSTLKVLKVLPVFYVAYLAFLLVSPIEYIYRTILIFEIIYIVFPVIVIGLIVYIVIIGQTGIWALLITAIAVFCNSLAVTFSGRSEQPIHYPIDLLVAVTALSAFWFSRYFQSTLDTVQLSKKLQKEVDQKDDFLANTSHELRNPLHGIMNIAQTLLEKDANTLSTENKTNLQLLIRISNHMSFMLDDLLDLVHLKEQKVQLQKVPLNIYSMATGVSETYRYMLKGKPVELLVKVPKDLPFVMADENRLIQIFSNLIHNAIKFTDNGTITIDAVVQGDKIVISIKDTGIGIDESVLGTIFDPYEQVDSSMTSIGGGLGLGLSICRDFILLHGGNIEVSSIVGKGSTFTFMLPQARKPIIEGDNHTEALYENNDLLSQYEEMLNDYTSLANDFTAVTHENRAIVSSNPRILVVDDDVVNLQVLVNLLSMEKYVIDTALNGKEAFEKIEKNHYDLVISDIMMPHMSGYELAERIREKFSIVELPILFLTARRQRDDIARGFLAGGNDHVTKPTEYIELKARVNALVRVKQSSEERLRMEGAWLQAQIQPHFFFNTLNSIISLHTIDLEKMEALLFAFSDYLQMSFAFQNAELLVPIDDELDTVRAYITIQQIRFDDRLTVVWDVPDNIQLSVPPLSIQTLVENAIEHGILERVEGGTVTIRITQSDEQFTVFIIDDGVGFDDKAPKDKESVGFINTSQRLKQLFGTELRVDSVVNKGTTVSFSIPK